MLRLRQGAKWRQLQEPLALMWWEAVRCLVGDNRVLVFAIGTIGLLLVAASPAASQATVQRVDVTITVEDVTPPPAIVDQLHSTVQTVADRLLLSRSLDTLQPSQSELEKALGDVIGRVATGYAVSSVAIGIGVSSTVTVRLKPQGTVIRTAEVGVDLQAIHPKLRPLFMTLMQRGGVIDEVRALYIGVPVLAWDWVGPILEARARSAVASVLRGYTASVRARPAEPAHVDLVVAVEDSRTIRYLSVRFRSASIPILLLDQHAPEVASIAEPLRGVPVAFAQAHQRDLEQLLETELAAFPPVREYGIVASVGLDIAETTYMTVVADSLTWRGRVEAQLNIGSRAPGPTILVHLGRVLVAPTEAFAEVRIIPNTLGVEWDLGAQYAVAPTTFVGLRYGVSARTTTAFTRFQVSPDVGLRGEWNFTDQSFEGGISYRANDFLSGELVGTSRGEVWLRLISNL